MKDLNEKELKTIEGGHPAIVFVAGALLGGAIYDGWKYLARSYASRCAEGAYDGVGYGR